MLHDILELLSLHRSEAHIGRGNHTYELIVLIENGEAVELKPHALFLASQKADVVVLMEADGSGDKAVEIVLNLGDFARLLVLFEVFMNNADTARKSHRDGHRSFGYRIHRGGDEGNFHLRAAGEIRLERRIVGQKIGILSHKRDIVIRKTFVRKGLHERIHIFIHNFPFGRISPFDSKLYQKKGLNAKRAKRFEV